MAELDRIAEFYRAVFAGGSDAVPIIASPPCPGGPTRRELVTDAARAVRQAAGALAPKVEAGSDWVPSVNIGWYQGIAVPSLYGAEAVFPEGSEPVCRPAFESAGEAARAGVPEVAGPVIDEMLRVAREAKAALPEGFRLSFPATASPWDLAQLVMSGEEFLVALMTEPDAATEFLVNLAELCVRVTNLVKRELGEGPGETVTNRGIPFPGLRLPSDAIVNLSPELLRRFVLPVLERFAREYGRLMVHFCTKPAPSGHVLAVLAECEHVAAVDNWQGPHAFLGPDAADPMQSHVGVVTDLDLTTPGKMDEFLSLPAVRDVPRRGGRGLVVSTWAPSVDEARRIVALWRERTPAFEPGGE